MDPLAQRVAARYAAESKLKAVFHAIIGPFKKVYDLVTSREARQKTWAFLKGAVRRESRETRDLGVVIKRLLTGQKVTSAQKSEALHQVADLAKIILIGTFAAHLAAGGLSHLLATIASPADELVGIAIDKPLRRATERFLGKAHGILPTAFYEDHTAADADRKVDAVLAELVNLFFDEVEKQGIDQQALEREIARLVPPGP